MNGPGGLQPITPWTAPRSVTVRDLIIALLDEDLDARVSVGHAPGPLAALTGTTGGWVILDAARAPQPRPPGTSGGNNADTG